MSLSNIARNFLSNPDAALLSDDAKLTRTRSTISGKDAVFAEVKNGPAGQAYKLAQWSKPIEADGSVKIVGEVPPNELTGQVTVTFFFSGEQISHIQHQSLLPRPAFDKKIVLPDDVKDVIRGALADGRPFAIAHVDEKNTPVLTYRGSLTVLGDDRVAFWSRDANGGFVQSITKNPNVAMIYRNNDNHGYYNLKGRASVAKDRATHDLVRSAIPEAERQWDPAASGVAIVIELDRVEGWSGSRGAGPNVRVNMERG